MKVGYKIKRIRYASLWTRKENETMAKRKLPLLKIQDFQCKVWLYSTCFDLISFLNLFLIIFYDLNFFKTDIE